MRNLCKIGIHHWVALGPTVVFKQALIEEFVDQVFDDAKNKERTKRYWKQALTLMFTSGQPIIYDRICKYCGKVDFQTLGFVDKLQNFMDESVPESTMDDRILKMYAGALHEKNKRHDKK